MNVLPVYDIQIGTPAAAEAEFLWHQLDTFNSRYVEIDYRRLTITARAPSGDPTGEIVGGLIGVIGWEWLHVDLLWIHEAWRGQGIGSTLLQTAEAEAVKAGCHHVHVDTMSFQAPDFYRRHGYTEFAVFPDHPTGHSRHFFMKDLRTGAARP